MSILIRPLQATDEYHACEALQRTVWAMPDDLDVVPMHLLVTVQRSGGVLLGAFDGDDLVGFVFGFPGLADEGRIVHCSHMMGVAPGYQGMGVGFRLKLAQRELALDQGADLMTWTYDPLESRNAYLNMHKLGAVCRSYVRDYYGPLTDGLNVGLPSDRFQVEWWLTSERVVQRLGGREDQTGAGRGLLVNATGFTSEGLPTPGMCRLEARAPTVQVEIPSDYQAIKAAYPGLAEEWRRATREIFEYYFAAGYAVVGFRSRLMQGGRRSFYTLQLG